MHDDSFECDLTQLSSGQRVASFLAYVACCSLLLDSGIVLPLFWLADSIKSRSAILEVGQPTREAMASRITALRTRHPCLRLIIVPTLGATVPGRCQTCDIGDFSRICHFVRFVPILTAFFLALTGGNALNCPWEQDLGSELQLV